jgi:hypothetical protein
MQTPKKGSAKKSTRVEDDSIAMHKGKNSVGIRSYGSKNGTVVSNYRKDYSDKNLAGNTRSFTDSYKTTMDTTGYSKGKPLFIVTKNRRTPTLGNTTGSHTKIIHRKDVPKQIEKMKKGTGRSSMKKGGTLKSKKK